MKSHLYLIGTTLKNQIKELLRSPKKLIPYLLLVLLLTGSLIAPAMGADRGDSFGQLDIQYLAPLVFAFLAIYYFVGIQKGLSTGDDIFGMNDVNFLFVAPVDPRYTLLYGILRTILISFGSAIFLLFQGSNLSTFGVDFRGILKLFPLLILFILVMTLLSLVIYSASNGRPFRKRLVRIFSLGIFLPLLLSFLRTLYNSKNLLSAFQQLIQGAVFKGTPFLGWAATAAVQLVQGKLLPGLGWSALLLLSGLLLLLYLLFSKADYYEDVLVATETAFERKRIQSESVQNLSAGAARAKVRVKKTGLWGSGAPVFLSKHLRESLRQNPLGFLDPLTLIMGAGGLVFSLLLREPMIPVILLLLFLWIQIFRIGTGRGLLETYTHYIYMVPASPFKKLIWCSMEQLFRTAAESLLLLGIPGIGAGGNFFVVLMVMLCYILFNFMLLGINYVSLRFTGAGISQGILLVLYFIMVILLLAPGVVAGVVVAVLLGGSSLGLFLAALTLSLWELLVGAVCFYLSRNILNHCDMPNIPAPK